MKGKAISPRQRRKYRIRKNIFGTEACPRLSVYRSDKYTYAQVISDIDGKTLVSSSTKGASSGSAKGVEAAKALGLDLAAKCKAKGIEKVTFDRNGFLFHGRVKAVADGAREGGIKV